MDAFTKLNKDDFKISLLLLLFSDEHLLNIT